MTKGAILIVDDDESLLKLYEERFRLAGYDVVGAKDGEGALAAVQKKKPDCILLDLMMPNIDGMAVLDNLKTLSETKDIPIIVLTALGRGELENKARALGADDYIVKSETIPAEVVQRVEAAVQKGKDLQKK